MSQLDQLRFLVIDEADRMVEQGHFQELASILDLIHISGYMQPTKCKIVGLDNVSFLIRSRAYDLLISSSDRQATGKRKQTRGNSGKSRVVLMKSRSDNFRIIISCALSPSYRKLGGSRKSLVLLIWSRTHDLLITDSH